jgi:recombination associated protein RdgC
MTWNSRVSFILTEALTLKKIELLDVVLENQPQKAGKDDDGGFDADVALTTGELRQLMPDLVLALGGLQQALVKPSAASPAPAL